MCNTCIKSKRFKDGSCTYKNTGSSHLKPQLISIHFFTQQLRGFAQRSKHFPLGDHFIYSHKPFFVLILSGENWCWSLLGLLTMEINVREEITIKWQNYSFLSNKYTSSSISNVINNKNKLWKTVRLTSFQKPTITIRCNLLQVWPSVPYFIFTVLFIPS